jgi:hypothetical protein
MKRLLVVMMLLLIPSLVLAAEEDVLQALENIRNALDKGVAEPVSETLDRLVNEAKAAVKSHEDSSGRGTEFTVNAKKSLDYFENIARMIKMGYPPFEADRTQADKFLLEAHRIQREHARKTSQP